MNICVYIKISDVNFKLILRNPRIEEFYKKFLRPPTDDAITIEVTDEMINSSSTMKKGAAELLWQRRQIGDELVNRNRMLFHGCAFLWKGNAYIFTAPSGTGKTTQFLLWHKQFGDEISILNGDKPVLDFCEDGVFVRPSPWRGKERLSSMQSAPLKGLIYLCQADENKIKCLEPKEAAPVIYNQVLYSARDEETVQAAARLTEKMLYSVKTWQLDNCGDEASAILCHDALEEEL